MWHFLVIWFICFFRLWQLNVWSNSLELKKTAFKRVEVILYKTNLKITIWLVQVCVLNIKKIKKMNFSAFYSLCSVVEAWTNPSPWSIFSKQYEFKKKDFLIFLLVLTKYEGKQTSCCDPPPKEKEKLDKYIYLIKASWVSPKCVKSNRYREKKEEEENSQ